MSAETQAPVIVDERTKKYIEESSQLPLLSFKRECELADVIQDSKDVKLKQNAIDELVKHNLRLVISEAYSFNGKTGIDVGDLIGAGNEGLMHAVEKFKPREFNTKFSTYATYWIKEAMQDLAYRSMSVVTIPVHISNGVAKEKKLLESGKPINDKEMQKALGVSDAGLKRIRNAHTIHSVSIDQKISGASGEGEHTVGDIIEDSRAVDPSMGVESLDRRDLLYEALDELDEVSRAIIMARYLDGEKVQLRKLGKQFEVTGERIRQISQKALKQLRKKMEIKFKHGKKTTKPAKSAKKVESK
jgi:RNA polymerase sigma factor (sigma-70 family)